jgi:hypothetical protein
VTGGLWANGGLDVAELSRYLFLAGALPFIVLGTIHAIETPTTPEQAKGLSPRDPEYRQGMRQQTLVLTRRTNLWLTWVGFNLSHSLGAVLFGVAVLLAGRSTSAFEANAPFVPFAVVVSAAYLAIGLLYWFRTPIIGISISVVCFVASWMLRMRA